MESPSHSHYPVWPILPSDTTMCMQEKTVLIVLQTSESKTILCIKGKYQFFELYS